MKIGDYVKIRVLENPPEDYNDNILQKMGKIFTIREIVKYKYIDEDVYTLNGVDGFYFYENEIEYFGIKKLKDKDFDI